MVSTWRKFVLDYLDQRCVMADDAQEILAAVIEAPTSKPMANRWDDNVADYPEFMRATIVVGINLVADEWFEKNAPQLWNRSLFKTSTGEAA